MSEGGSIDEGAREEALRRIDALEAEIAGFRDSVGATAAAMLTELALARAAVEQLHAVAASENGGGETGVDEGARLVALDLMTRGVERAEAERELRAAFPGVDPRRALDEAAATLGH